MCVPSDDSDQPAHSRSLIRIFIGRILDNHGCRFSNVDNEDCAYVQTDLNFCWAHMPECKFFHVVALVFLKGRGLSSS